MTNPVAVSIHNAQFIVLKFPFLFKKIEGPLGELMILKMWQEISKMGLEYPVLTDNKEAIEAIKWIRNQPKVGKISAATKIKIAIN